MARGEIKIPMAVDTSGIQKEIDNGLVKPLDKVEDALKSLEKVDAGKDLERDLEKASKATKELDDDLDDARKGLQRLGFASKKIDDDTKSGFGKASENVEEFKNEAAQNFSEVTSSFNGSMESILDLAQGTLGGLASGISGPLGIALGVAAAGIGLVVNGLIEGEEHAEELRQKAVEFANAAIDAGVSTESWLTGAAQVVERIRELEELKSTDFRMFWDEDPTQLEEWTDALEKLNRPAEEIGDILSSSTDSVKDYRDAIEEARRATLDELDAIAQRVTAAGESSEADQARVESLREELEGSKDLIEQLDEEIKLRDSASDSAQRQRDAGVDAALARAQAEEDAADAIKSAQESVEQSALSAYDTMRSAAYDKSTADDAAFDTGKWLTYVEETRALADGYKANLANMKLTPEEWENFLALPEDARSNIAASYQTAGEDGKERIRNALSDTGSTAGSEATVGFNDAFQPEADVTVDVDTAKAEAALTDVAKKRTAEIKVKTTGKAEANRDLDDLARTRHATIRVEANTSPANADVNSWRRNQESRPLYITVRTRSGGTQLV